MTDTIADFLIRIKNGYMARKEFITAPYSNYKEQIADVLQKNGYIKKIEVRQKNKTSKKTLVITLVYQDNTPKIQNIQFVSKKSRRIYVKKDSIDKVLGGIGISLISTSKGVMTDKQARKQKIGGEVICRLW